MRRLSIRLSKEQADISVLTNKQAHLIASERNEMSYPFSLTSRPHLIVSERNEMSYPFSLTSRNFSYKLYITKHIYAHIHFLAQTHVDIFMNLNE